MKDLLSKEILKNILITLFFISIVSLGMTLYVEKVKEIDSGKIKVIYQYGGDL